MRGREWCAVGCGVASMWAAAFGDAWVALVLAAAAALLVFWSMGDEGVRR